MGVRSAELKEKLKKKILALEMDFRRRSARTSRREKVINYTIRERRDKNTIRDIWPKLLVWTFPKNV
jgi:hypothetical protein